jgi:adenine-specific DNA-methyltransferase
LRRYRVKILAIFNIVKGLNQIGDILVISHSSRFYLKIWTIGINLWYFQKKRIRDSIQKVMNFSYVKYDIDSLISKEYTPSNPVTLFEGDCIEILQTIPDEEATLIVTSPPYNIGKKYEKRKILSDYLSDQKKTIKECVRILARNGSICWQIGNHIDSQEIYPLDLLLYPIFKEYHLKLRNRIIWHFEHGLHCSKRFSGRYETILWFTKTDDYIFNLDAVRVPQKYPGKKYFKGPKVGQYSCNPLGKNPGDLWIIPNVKHNHPEKTSHPCQFPIELIERLILSLTNEGDLVVDPYLGVGTTAVAAVLRNRRAAGAEIVEEYNIIAKERIMSAFTGKIKRRPMDKPIYEPSPSLSVANPPKKFNF